MEKEVLSHRRWLTSVTAALLVSSAFLLQCKNEISVPRHTTLSAIASWAFPDGAIVTGDVKIGVVAYYPSGITKVDFSLDGTFKESVAEETLNTDTNEYEYLLKLDATALSDGEHKIKATAIPNPATGVSTELPELTIHVANSTTSNTWYVDSNSGDDSKNGGSGDPWRTLERALGTGWETQDLEPRARGGDTVLLKPGTYDLPSDQYGTHTKYITIKPETSGTVTIKGGALRSPFMKFEDIQFSAAEGGGVQAYLAKAHHYWFKDCTFTGYGKIWPDANDFVGFVRSSTDSHDVIVENCTIQGAAQGVSLIGQGNYITRNCQVYDQTGDGMKFGGENVLFTGNTIHDVAAPKAWSVSKKPAPYECTGIALTFHLSTDYGVTFPQTFSVSLSGSGQTVPQVVAQLNANGDFTGNGFVAEVSASPYPFPGNIRLEKTGAETNQFFITGDTSTVFNFSDNTRDLNDISQAKPAKYSTDHCDFMANDDGDIKNAIIRHNKMWGGRSQGIKLDGISRDGIVVHAYKDNLAIVNNLIAGDEESATLFYMVYRGSGAPPSVLHFNNVLIANNTIYKPATGTVRGNIYVNMDNPDLVNITIKNNIIGDYFTGDWPLEDREGGVSDYNLFTDDTHKGEYNANEHSLLGNAAFENVSNWDFSLSAGSDAKGKADPSVKIKYDVDWNPRSSTAPSMGCYE